ncbi:EFR1 family ferrodoxin [Treponema primitia]|uniref:EFR1 family ferrodoxin n=1 Tax=Treponema primitia TaxID=88058 RepID=UPI00397FC383
MANIIFYFTGTGNSLRIAKTVSNTITDCEIIPMGTNRGITINKEYDRIGFVYPVYFWGVPKIVRDFVSDMRMENNKGTYFYAIATNGGFAGNGLKLLNKLLLEKNIKLKYGKALKIFSNYIISFTMPGKFKKLLEKSDKILLPMLESIKNKKPNSIGKINKKMNQFYEKYVSTFQYEDKNYTVDGSCVGCGICKEVCPVHNIELIGGKPEFKHTCEQCMACIQYCPQRAINYKGKTEGKVRYTHPEISYKELAESNNIKYRNA